MIPVSVLSKLATIGLNAEQATAVAEMLSEVEAATKEDAGAAINARRAADRERKARQRSHAPSREVTGSHGTDCDADTAKEKTPQTPQKENPSPKEKPPKGGQKKRGSRLSENWVLPSEYRAWAIEHGFPANAVDVEADRFRDYWIAKSGSGAVKVDWLATWRGWIRNTDRFGTIQRQAPPGAVASVPADTIRLSNGNSASRAAILSKLRRWYGAGQPEWKYTPAWSDDFPPGHPKCVIPPDLINEAQASFSQHRATG